MSEIEQRRLWRWRAGSLERVDDELAREEPLEIRVDGRPVSVTMRTPGHDDELAAGFLLSEGIVDSAATIEAIVPLDGRSECNVIDVRLAPGVAVDFERLTRHVFASSSCGLCGKATIEALRRQFAPIETRLAISPELAQRLPERLRRAQETFSRTGGLHAAAVFDAEGELLVLREDVGRHNAVDKVLGRGLISGWMPFDRHILLVSGRASFEIVQKALAGRVPIVAAISAPSSLAIELAEENGQTLIGFLRDDTMNIYAGAQRLVGDDDNGHQTNKKQEKPF